MLELSAVGSLELDLPKEDGVREALDDLAREEAEMLAAEITTELHEIAERYGRTEDESLRGICEDAASIQFVVHRVESDWVVEPNRPTTPGGRSTDLVTQVFEFGSRQYGIPPNPFMREGRNRLETRAQKKLKETAQEQWRP